MARDDLVYFDQMVDSLRSAIRDGQAGLGDVPGLLKKVLRQGMWRKRVVQGIGRVQTFERFEDFVRTAPLEGLGADLAIVKRLAGGDPELLDLIDQETVGKQGERTDIVYNIHEVPIEERPSGTSAKQALRRLRNQRPDLHSQVLAGEKSPHAAMIEAGFRKRSITVPLDVSDAARILARHFDVTELIRALALVGAEEKAD